MKKNIFIAGMMLLCFGISSVQAADVKEKYLLKNAMELQKVKDALENDIAFYWGDSPHSKVLKNFGSYKTSKRTNAFMKDREQSCAWAMASALTALRDRARSEGGNAVINILSNIKNNEESSSTEYSCLAGRVMVNVALKGTVVKLAQ